MRLHELYTKEKPSKWLIGYELLDKDVDTGERYSTVLDAYSEDDALEQFNDNFWRIAFGDPTNEGPPGVDARKLYDIIEVRPATERDRGYRD